MTSPVTQASASSQAPVDLNNLKVDGKLWPFRKDGFFYGGLLGYSRINALTGEEEEYNSYEKIWMPVGRLFTWNAEGVAIPRVPDLTSPPPSTPSPHFASYRSPLLPDHDKQYAAAKKQSASLSPSSISLLLLTILALGAMIGVGAAGLSGALSMSYELSLGLTIFGSVGEAILLLFLSYRKSCHSRIFFRPKAE